MDELFAVKHYNDDERPIIKGNFFDGLAVGEDREDAEAFIEWVNARIDGLQNLEAAVRAWYVASDALSLRLALDRLKELVPPPPSTTDASEK